MQLGVTGWESQMQILMSMIKMDLVEKSSTTKTQSPDLTALQ